MTKAQVSTTTKPCPILKEILLLFYRHGFSYALEKLAFSHPKMFSGGNCPFIFSTAHLLFLFFYSSIPGQFMRSFLKICSLVAQKLHLDERNIQKTQTVLDFFKAQGFTDTHIAQLIQNWPPILHCNIECNLKPKVYFFVKDGFVGELLPQLLAPGTEILKKNLDSYIKPLFEILKPFLDINEKIVAAKRNPWLLSYGFKNSLRPNIDLLIKQGVTVNNVAKLLMVHSQALQIMHGRMVLIVNALKNLGLDPKSPVFIRALRVMAQMSESTWNNKLEVMKSLGWSEEEILFAFKRSPIFLACSEKKIRSAMDFLLNTIKMKKQSMVGHPQFLMYSVDIRLRPRHKVLKILESKELFKWEKKVETLFDMSETDFLANYVTKFADEVPGLLQIYGTAEEGKKIDA